MDKENYTNLWKKIASKYDMVDCYALQFWKELEDSMSPPFQRCFLIGQKRKIIALDDDKRHYDNNSVQDTQGSKLEGKVLLRI